MSHTVDTSASWAGSNDFSGDRPRVQDSPGVAEQDIGALIFRYSIGADAAASLIALWAAEAGVPPDAVARAIVLDICQGLPGTGSDLALVRWLEDRLRQEVSLETLQAAPAAGLEDPPPGPEPDAAAEPALEEVVVAVDHSEVSLDAVVEASRRAARLGVALRVTADAGSVPGAEADHLARRVDLAVDLARTLEPGLRVLRPGEDRAGHG